MRILVTNDDGIHAPGLAVLETIAADLAGPDAEIWVVAPSHEQSGVAHCISYTHPMLLTQTRERRFSTTGSPADCVLAGLHEVMQDAPPDIILSGVNRGNNSAENALYSGTLGGAIEGALQGIPSFALSQFYGPENVSLDNPFEAAAQHGADLLRRLIDRLPAQDQDYRLFFNINFPPVPGQSVKGVRIAPQGYRRNTRFTVEPQNSPAGKRFLWIKGGGQHVATAPGSDAAVNLDGYISVTPMRADFTAHEALDTFRDIES